MSGLRHTIVTLVLAVLVVGILGPRAALAEAPGDRPAATVAVLPLRVEGELEPHVRAQLQDRLGEGIARGDVGVVSLERVQAAAPGVDVCEDAACLAEAARATGAALAVHAVVKAQGRDYRLALEILDAKDGAVLQKRDAACEICGTAEVIEQIGNEASALVPFIVEYTQARSVLEVRSVPAGARVLVDGNEVGTTPFSGEVLAGDRVVEVSKPGYTLRERRVAVGRGATTLVDVELDRVEPERKPAPHAALGWTPIGVGAAAVGAGVALIVIEEDPVAGRCDAPENVDAFGTCRYRYKTLESGIAMAAVGAALIVAGAVVLGIRAKRGRGRPEHQAARARRLGGDPSGLWVRF